VEIETAKIIIHTQLTDDFSFYSTIKYQYEKMHSQQRFIFGVLRV